MELPESLRRVWFIYLFILRVHVRVFSKRRSDVKLSFSEPSIRERYVSYVNATIKYAGIRTVWSVRPLVGVDSLQVYT